LAEHQTPERRLQVLADLIRTDPGESAPSFVGVETRLEIDGQ
jgi:hypothetical protein